MSRPRVSVPLEAIRIEDEVWQDAFALAQDVAARRRRRMHALEGGAALATDDVPRVRPAPVDDPPRRARDERSPVPVRAAMPGRGATTGGGTTAAWAIRTGGTTAATATVAKATASAAATDTIWASDTATFTEPSHATALTGDARPVGGRQAISEPVAGSWSVGEQVAERRTVTIRGYGGERNLPWSETARRRPQRPVHERAGFRPDRLAMWAVLLGVLLVLVAVASGHG